MLSNEFVTSDLHFNHANIIKYCNRPFSSSEEMDKTLIHNWNSKIRKNDPVYILGDLIFFKSYNIQYAKDIISSLNGRLHLVKGNHDRSIEELKEFFIWIKDYHEMTLLDGTKVIMSHFPFLVWNKSHYGSWMLHGHCHGNLQETNVKRLDVGIDTSPNYEPYSFDEISKRMKLKTFEKVDHHGD